MRLRADSLLGFAAVPVRARRDGWSHGVQVAFIAYLRVTGCVEEACRRVGRSRESAYKLYRRPDAAGFREAWEAALAGAAAAPATRKLPPVPSTSASGPGARLAAAPVPAWSLLGMMAALGATAEGPMQSSTSSTSSTSAPVRPTVNFREPFPVRRAGVGGAS
jgi:hypothetical protein